METYQASIRENFQSMSLEVTIVRGDSHYLQIARPTDSGRVDWLPVDDGIGTGPTLVVPLQARAAFVDAMSEFLGGTQGPAALRKDYEAERARVDNLIGTVQEIALRRPR